MTDPDERQKEDSDLRHPKKRIQLPSTDEIRKKLTIFPKSGRIRYQQEPEDEVDVEGKKNNEGERKNR